MASAVMGVWGEAPAGSRAEPLVGESGGEVPLKLKASEHLASNADGKFAKILCILQIPFVSHRWLRKNALVQLVGFDPLRQARQLLR